MLITDEFVFVHLPKTGGMFVDGVVKDALYPTKLGRQICSLRSRYGIQIPFFPYRYTYLRRHASCAAIPVWATDRRIVGCMRHPCDWYVSDFRFEVWKQERSWTAYWEDTPANKTALFEAFPRFPELKFGEYLQASSQFTCRVLEARRRYPLAASLGLLTLEFLRMYCRDRQAVLSGDEKGFVARAREHLYDVHFLQQGNLNQQLADFLRSCGYPEEMAKKVQQWRRIFPGKQTRPSGDSWQNYYSNETLSLVRYQDRLLFELFPEFDTDGC